MMRPIAIAACALLALVSLLASARAVSAGRKAALSDMPYEQALLAATQREAAALDRAVMALERRREELETDGICQLEVVTEAATLVDAAATHAVDLSRVEVDSTHQSIAATASGEASALRNWLSGIDGQTQRGCAVVTSFHLSPRDPATLTLRLTALYGMEAIRAHPTAGSDSWPLPTADQLAAAFAGSPDPAERDLPDPGAPASSTEPIGPHLLPTTPPSYLGVISSLDVASGATRERVALRLGENGQVVVLLPGETAFGWRLRTTDGHRLMMEHEGEHYEISRD